jgi:hypothetical protein
VFGQDEQGAEPRRSSQGRLLLVLLLPIPALFLFQLIIRQMSPSAPLLVGELDVRLGAQDPYHLVIQLDPVAGKRQVAGWLRLEGEAKLRKAAFPWPEAPFHARLAVEFSGDQLNARQPPFVLTSDDDGFVAWYQERYVRGGSSFSAQVPCSGRVDVDHVAAKVDGAIVEWSQVFEFDGTLALDCVNPGRDLEFDTEDDLRWSIEGPIGLRWRSPRE